MSIGASPARSNFPGGFGDGLTIRGVNLAVVPTGQVFWVSNSTVVPPGCAGGSDNNRGTFQRPFATIAGALAQCVADRGDLILVKPGHAESITTAGALALSVAGVQIVGLGTGQARPTLTWSGVVGASLNVTAARVALRNFYLNMTGLDNITSGINVSAADFTLDDCSVRTATAAAQAALGLTSTAAADRLTVTNCTFFGTTDAGTTAALQLVGGDQITIANNTFFGAYSAGVGAINNITTAMTNAVIDGNRINNATAVSTKAMVFVAGSTGLIANNRMQILSGTAPITGAAMSWVGANYYAATIATAGTLI
jgi:hypothetical protein